MHEPQLSVVYGALAVLATIYFIRWRRNPVRTASEFHRAWCPHSCCLHQLHKIPTVGGPNAPILSYWSAINYAFNGRKILTEGYEKVRSDRPSCWAELRRIVIYTTHQSPCIVPRLSLQGRPDGPMDGHCERARYDSRHQEASGRRALVPQEIRGRESTHFHPVAIQAATLTTCEVVSANG